MNTLIGHTAETKRGDMPIRELITEAMCTFSEAAGMPVYAIGVQTLRSSPG